MSDSTRWSKTLRATCFAAIAAGLFVVATAEEAEAQTIFVPIELGASYEPQQLNTLFVEQAIGYGQYQMKTLDERDDLLELYFPGLALPDVADLEQKFSTGQSAYFEGELQKAQDDLQGALKAASERLVALTLRPGFAESTLQGGLYLIQVLYFGLGDQDGSEKVIDILVKLFPTEVADQEQFPPELVKVYNSYLPNPNNGAVGLTIKVKNNCYARINGKDLEPQNSITLRVHPGDYGVAEVCEDVPTRAFVVPVREETTVDFHDDFAENFTYPISVGVNGRDNADPAFIAGILAEIGRRTGAVNVVGAGLSADGADYQLFLVDATTGKLTRKAAVPPAEVTDPTKMADVVNHLWTGEEITSFTPIGGAAVDWTLVGAITMGVGGGIAIGAVVTAVLAQGANDDFFACNEDPECRAREEDTDHLKNRQRLAIVADVLYGTSAAFLTAGLIMIIVDQVGGGGTETDEAAEAGDWTIDMHPVPEGGMGTFKIVF